MGSKKFYLPALIMLCASAVMAQETYQSANIATEGLNGTARYVGMGGALDALGADLSTIGSNPAGIGLFRHNVTSMSMSVNSQQDVPSFASGSKTHVGFDQIGIVFSERISNTDFVNLAFNYHKSRDFNQIVSAANKYQGASMNKLSYIKALLGNERNGGYWLDRMDRSNEMMGYANPNSNDRAFTYTLYDYLNTNVFTPGIEDLMDYGYDEASDYIFNRKSKGYIGEYDFNVSGNHNDRIYWGLTIGFSDVHYNDYTLYSEHLVSKKQIALGTADYIDEREITGNGFNVKIGFIARPIEYSPFRVGLSIATPTWYKLRTRSYTSVDTHGSSAWRFDYGETSNPEEYEFKLFTPWRFGLSLGHTVGNFLALGASYEYSDYSALDNRFIDYDSYSWWDYDHEYESSTSDKEMKRATEQALQGVSTFRLGAEMRPDPAIAVRIGYNYVSPMYKKNAVKTGQVLSYANTYTSLPDYTNWKATNRFTCGVGLKLDDINLDLAYQYSAQNGDFHPMSSISAYNEDMLESNNVSATSVSNKQHQVLMTIGYTF